MKCQPPSYSFSTQESLPSNFDVWTCIDVLLSIYLFLYVYLYIFIYPLLCLLLERPSFASSFFCLFVSLYASSNVGREVVRSNRIDRSDQIHVTYLCICIQHVCIECIYQVERFEASKGRFLISILHLYTYYDPTFHPITPFVSTSISIYLFICIGWICTHQYYHSFLSLSLPSFLFLSLIIEGPGTYKNPHLHSYRTAGVMVVSSHVHSLLLVVIVVAIIVLLGGLVVLVIVVV